MGRLAWVTVRKPERPRCAVQARAWECACAWAWLVQAGVSVVGCTPAAPRAAPLVVVVAVESDPGVPVGDARVLSAGKLVGTTGVDGTAQVALAGDEGQTVELSVACPEGYSSPKSPFPVVLRRLADPGKSPRYEATCRPATRTVVVAVSAEGGADLPLLYLGSEVARTDASGAAHAVLHIAPGEQFSVTLATTGKGAEPLRPRNPVATFTVGDKDEVFVFDPHFTVEPKRRSVSRPHGPTELGR